MIMVHEYKGQKDTKDLVCYCGCKGKKKPFKIGLDNRGLSCPSCGRVILDLYWKKRDA